MAQMIAQAVPYIMPMVFKAGMYGIESLIGWVTKKLKGSGSYAVGPSMSSIDSNSLLYPNDVTGRPSIAETIGGGIRVQHKEYLGPVYAQYYWRPATGPIGHIPALYRPQTLPPADYITGFNPYPSSYFTDPSCCFYFNPGLETTFPWLSSVARNYQEYRTNGAVFEYITRSSGLPYQPDGSVNLGTVVLTTQYNCADPGFPTRQSAENTQYTVTTSPGQSALHPIECNADLRPLQVQYVWNPEVTDYDNSNKFYNMCRTTVFCEDVPGDNGGPNNIKGYYDGWKASDFPNSIIGDLWIAYDIILLKTMLRSNAPTGAGDETAELTWTINPDGSSYELDLTPNVNEYVVEDGQISILPSPIGIFGGAAVTQNGDNQLFISSTNTVGVSKTFLSGLNPGVQLQLQIILVGPVPAAITMTSIQVTPESCQNVEFINCYSTLNSTSTAFVETPVICTSGVKGGYSSIDYAPSVYVFQFNFSPKKLGEDCIIPLTIPTVLSSGVFVPTLPSSMYITGNSGVTTFLPLFGTMILSSVGASGPSTMQLPVDSAVVGSQAVVLGGPPSASRKRRVLATVRP